MSASRKSGEVDSLHCGKCSGEMKIISFIYERAVIKKILVHLKLYSEPEQQWELVALAAEFFESVEHVSYDDGRPSYEEPSVSVKCL